jgi:hypothetical protein
MSKWRIKKLWPGDEDDVNIGDIWRGVDLFDEFNVDEPEQWPEFFEKVSEHILKTEDGYKIYDKNEKLYYIGRDWSIMKTSLNKLDIFSDDDNKKIFFEEKNAHQYVEENKPKWSDKDVIDFLDYAVNDNAYYRFKIIALLNQFKKHKSNENK